MSTPDNKWLLSPIEFLVDKADLHQKRFEQSLLSPEGKYESRSELDELNRAKVQLADQLLDDLRQTFAGAVLIYNENVLSPSIRLGFDQRQSDWTIRRGTRSLLFKLGELSLEIIRYEDGSSSSTRFGFAFYGKNVSLEINGASISNPLIVNENVAWLLEDE